MSFGFGDLSLRLGAGTPVRFFDLVKDGVLDSRGTDTVSGTRWYDDASGNRQTAGTNVSRIGYDVHNDNALLGLLGTPTYKNYLRNPRGEGAVAGTPGTNPTRWIAGASGAGVTKEIVGRGTDAQGRNYTRIRLYTATTTSGTSYAFYLEGISFATAAAGEVWIAWLEARYEGTPTGRSNITTLSTLVATWTSGGAQVSTLGTVNNMANISNTTELFTSGGRTLVGGTIAYANQQVVLGFASGVSFDITLDIIDPVLTRMAYVLPPVLPPAGSPATTLDNLATANADSITFPLSGFGIASGFGERIVARTAKGIGSVKQRLSEFYLDADNRIAWSRDTSRHLVCEVISGGSATASLDMGTLNDDTAFRLRWHIRGGTIKAWLNGAAKQSASAAIPSGLTTGKLMGSVVAGEEWGAAIEDHRLYRFDSSERGMQLESSIYTFYDDFYRADTTAPDLGTPPNGVAYQLYGAYAGSYPLPAATDGYISSGLFTAQVNSIVYAVQNLGTTVTTIGGGIKFTSAGGATANGTAAFLISPNDNKLIDTMGVHVAVTRSSASITKRINGGSFTAIAGASITFAAALSQGVIYEVTAEVIGNRLAFSLTGGGVSYSSLSDPDDDIVTYSGPMATWEIFHNSASMVDTVQWEYVFAS